MGIVNSLELVENMKAGTVVAALVSAEGSTFQIREQYAQVEDNHGFETSVHLFGIAGNEIVLLEDVDTVLTVSNPTTAP